MARALFPPPTPRIWEQPANLLLLLKAGRPAAFHIQGGEDNSCGAHPSIPPPGLQGQGHPYSVHVPQTQHWVSPERKEALEEPKQPDSALDLLCDHKHMAVPLWASSSSVETRAEALNWRSVVPKTPDGVASRTRFFKGWRVCSKEPPARAVWLKAPPCLRISPLSSRLPPAQSPMVARYHRE